MTPTVRTERRRQMDDPATVRTLGHDETTFGGSLEESTGVWVFGDRREAGTYAVCGVRRRQICHDATSISALAPGGGAEVTRATLASSRWEVDVPRICRTPSST